MQEFDVKVLNSIKKTSLKHFAQGMFRLIILICLYGADSNITLYVNANVHAAENHHSFS